MLVPASFHQPSVSPGEGGKRSLTIFPDTQIHDSINKLILLKWLFTRWGIYVALSKKFRRWRIWVRGTPHLYSCRLQTYSFIEATITTKYVARFSIKHVYKNEPISSFVPNSTAWLPTDIWVHSSNKTKPRLPRSTLRYFQEFYDNEIWKPVVYESTTRKW